MFVLDEQLVLNCSSAPPTGVVVSLQLAEVAACSRGADAGAPLAQVALVHAGVGAALERSCDQSQLLDGN